jgi:hypothetical protein
LITTERISHKQAQRDLDTLQEIADLVLNGADCEQVLRAKCRLGLMIDMWAMDAVAGPAIALANNIDTIDDAHANADTDEAYFVGVGDGDSDDSAAAGVQQALLAQFDAMGINEAKSL